MDPAIFESQTVRRVVGVGDLTRKVAEGSPEKVAQFSDLGIGQRQLQYW